MQDRILNPVGIQESILVLRLRNQSFDAELILREKMMPAKLNHAADRVVERPVIPRVTCWLCGGPSSSGACQCHAGAGDCNLVCRME